MEKRRANARMETYFCFTTQCLNARFRVPPRIRAKYQTTVDARDNTTPMKTITG